MRPWMLVAGFVYLLVIPSILLIAGLLGSDYQPNPFFVGAYGAIGAWVLRHQVQHTNKEESKSDRRDTDDND